MENFLAWIGQLVGTAIAGPGATVLGDPGLVADPDAPRGSPTANRIAGLLLMLGILLMSGLPLELLGVVAVVGALIIGVERMRAARRHP